MRRIIAAGIVLVTCLLANHMVGVSSPAGATVQAAAESVQLPLKVTLAPEWTKMWDRRSGWTNSDGIYSIPLDSNDSLGSATSTSRTLWLYSDPNIGTVNDATLVKSGTQINHAMSTLTGNTPQPANMNFLYGSRGNMTATNIFGTKYWLLDGVTVGSNVYILGYTVGAGYRVNRVDLIKVPIVGGSPDLANYSIIPNTPLVNTIGGHTVTFGAGIMDNRAVAGAPDPDGYIYVYGFRFADNYNSQLVVSRVLPQDYENFSNWQFWDGSSWTNDPTDANNEAAVLGPMHISNEFSVTPITTGIYAGKYMAIYTRGITSQTIEYSIADSPTGPFGEGTALFDTPDPGIYNGGSAVVYNAKAHPHLSPPGHLLVSYNGNLGGSTNEVYRSRWIDVDLTAYASKPVLANVSSQEPATASNSLAGFGPEYGVANSPFHKWCDTTPGDKWLQVDLGRTYYVSRYTLKNAQWGGESANLNTRDWKIQTSPDGTTWTDVDQVTGNTAKVTTRTFGETAARYVRVYITKATQLTTDDAARIYSFDVYGRTSAIGTDSRVNVALSKPVTASGYVSASTAPSKLVDGRWSDIYNDKWVDNTAGPKWVTVDLGQPYRISRYLVRHAAAAGEATRLSTNYFKLQSSPDGTNWTDVDTVDYNMLPTTDREVVPFNARYVRLYVTKATLSTDAVARIYELELYSDPLQNNWTLDETSGTSASDSSGGVTAAVNGAAWVPGHLSNALSFDGVNDYALVSNYPKPSTVATYSAWVKANSAATWGAILDNWGESTTGQLLLGLVGSTGKLGFYVTQSNGTYVQATDTTSLPLGQWVHVAAVMDGSLVRLYRNGSQVASAPYNGTLKSTFSPLGIGVKPNDAGTGPASSAAGYWNGSIDDVRVYAKALSNQEVAALASQ